MFCTSYGSCPMSLLLPIIGTNYKNNHVFQYLYLWYTGKWLNYAGIYTSIVNNRFVSHYNFGLESYYIYAM